MPNSKVLKSTPLSEQILLSSILFALFLSGLASVTNQIVWQRAIKIYLSGSDTLSSMIVVLVFMGGLGAGAFYVGSRAKQIKNPLLTLSLVEILLCIVNVCVAVLLGFDIAESIQAFHRAAFTFGVPLNLVYATVSILLLMLPCFLMGVTIPLVSEVSQRQLQVKEKSFIATLFTLNTIGAVGGALLSGVLLLPLLGQQLSLVFAAGSNAIAGIILLCLIKHPSIKSVKINYSQKEITQKKIRAEELIAFVLGFLALAYEMYLFRIVALAYKPLPDHFSIILSFYLLMWSLGVFFARKGRKNLSLLFISTSTATLLVPILFYFRIWGQNSFVFSFLYTIPCFGFGLIFGQLLERCSQNWGNDVGRFYGFNTLGSCLGILVATLIGYEFNHICTPIVLGIAYFLLYFYAQASSVTEPLAISTKRKLSVSSIVVILLVVSLGFFQMQRHPQWFKEQRASKYYFGSEGVIQILNNKNLVLNGLWHSNLSNEDHVGTNNWLQATLPLLHYSGPREKLEVLVIGLGTVITASTLARSKRIERVDAYEINPKLHDVFSDYPEGTLDILSNPKVQIFWQDARKGLVLNDRKYDLIVQAPLYLKQAGSSFLLSKEYFALVKRHLKPHGIFSIYCNSLGDLDQASLVRKTARAVFQNGESFKNGYLLVVSDHSLQGSFFAETNFKSDKSELDLLEQEIAIYGMSSLQEHLDRPKLNWTDSPVIITDDRPLVEYPLVFKLFID